ncbi:hypothetical protein AB0B45_06780 [Nonomuraea sp. NPDC049152]
MPLTRAMLGAFAELVRSSGDGPVVAARLLEEPGEGQKRQYACLLARKSG